LLQKTAQRQVLAVLEVPGGSKHPSLGLAGSRGETGATPAILGAYLPWLGMLTCLLLSCGSSMLLSAPCVAVTTMLESGKFLSAKITPKGFYERKIKKKSELSLC